MTAESSATNGALHGSDPAPDSSAPGGENDLEIARIEDFYRRASAVASGFSLVMRALGTNPHLTAIACSQVITAAINEISRRSPQEAKIVIDELALGLMTLDEKLNPPSDNVSDDQDRESQDNKNQSHSHA